MHINTGVTKNVHIHILDIRKGEKGKGKERTELIINKIAKIYQGE